MHQLILPRDDDNQYRTFDGKQVVLLDSASANYREWLVTIGNERYCIVNEADTWTLMIFHSDRRQCWEDVPQTVDDFLQTHHLILAA